MPTPRLLNAHSKEEFLRVPTRDVRTQNGPIDALVILNPEDCPRALAMNLVACYAGVPVFRIVVSRTSLYMATEVRMERLTVSKLQIIRFPFPMVMCWNPTGDRLEVYPAAQERDVRWERDESGAAVGDQPQPTLEPRATFQAQEQMWRQAIDGAARTVRLIAESCPVPEDEEV